MIELYYWTTPNGHKITIFLEESKLPYRLIPIDISKGEQFSPDFIAKFPNNKIPGIIDLDPLDHGKPITLFESGAILLYLADKSNQFISSDIRVRNVILQWVFWQMAGLGPMSGQKVHFARMASEKIPYAIDRYSQEVTRLFGVLNKQLHQHQFIAGDYSIADMSCYPWIAAYEKLDIDLNQYPHIKRWFTAIQARPAVQRAYEIAKEINPQ